MQACLADGVGAELLRKGLGMEVANVSAIFICHMGADRKCKSKNYERACVFEHPRL